MARIDPGGRFTGVTAFEVPGLKAIALAPGGGLVAVGNAAVSGAAGLFVVKLDARGQVLWRRKLSTSTGAVGVVTVAISNAGSVFLAGAFQGLFNCAGQQLHSTDVADVFVAEIDHGGNLVRCWDRGGAGVQHVEEMSVAEDGTLLLAGSFEVAGGRRSGFHALIALDQRGKLKWMTPPAMSRNTMGRGVVIDRSGAAVVYGDFDRPWKIGASRREPVGTRDIFVAKVGRGGRVLSATTYGSIGMDSLPVSAFAAPAGALLVLFEQRSSTSGVLGRVAGTRYWLKSLRPGKR